MITVILEDEASNVISRISQPKNQTYLCQQNKQYELLSELDECSYDVFAQEDMPKLIEELTVLKKSLRDCEGYKHLEDIIELANRCLAERGTTLTFTPFEP